MSDAAATADMAVPPAGPGVSEHHIGNLDDLNPVSPAHRDQPVSYTVQSEGIEDDGELGTEGDGTLDALKAWAERHNRRNGRS